jgi:4-amino-4-deoxy-L-arabinose transferase-like glycosyltransferase
VSARAELTLVLVACLLAYGSGLGDVPFYTRGEPREGLVVREMVRTGEWIVPARPEGEVARKPPLFYWLAAPLLRAMPDAPELALRLPSAALATAAVALVWAVARAAVGGGAALPAALVLATSFEWTRAATSARVDMALAAPLAAVLAAWMLVLAGRDRRWLVLAAAGATAATLAKGPVALAVPALAAAALAAALRDAGVVRRLGVLPVLGAAALAAGAWYAAAFAEQGRAFFDVVVKENVVRFIDTDDARTGHAHGLLYLLALGLVGLLPWVPLLPLVRVRRADGRAAPLLLCAAWAAVVLVFFSAANAKRSVYLLPAFPGVAILVGAGAAEGGGRLARGAALLYLPGLVVMAALAAAAAAGVDPVAWLGAWLRPDDAYGAAAVAATAVGAASLVVVLATATAAAALAIERTRRAGAWTALVAVVAGLTVVWTAAFDTVVHPAIARTRSLAQFMREEVDRYVPPDAVLDASFPPDPGLRFYAPRPLARLRPDAPPVSPYALLWEDEWKRWRDDRGESLRPLAVSAAQQAGRGHLALVLIPPGHTVSNPTATH